MAYARRLICASATGQNVCARVREREREREREKEFLCVCVCVCVRAREPTRAVSAPFRIHTHTHAQHTHTHTCERCVPHIAYAHAQQQATIFFGLVRPLECLISQAQRLGGLVMSGSGRWHALVLKQSPLACFGSKAESSEAASAVGML